MLTIFSRRSLFVFVPVLSLPYPCLVPIRLSAGSFTKSAIPPRITTSKYGADFQTRNSRHAHQTKHDDKNVTTNPRGAFGTFVTIGA